MIEKILMLFKVKDLRSKIFFVLIMLAIFRIAAAIPVPSIDVSKVKSFFANNEFFGLLNIFSGGGMSNFSVVMLGVGPYITASIIMQLLTMIFPKIEELYKEGGEAGRAKFNQYSRYLAIPLAILQSYGMITLLKNQQAIGDLSALTLITTIIIVSAGTTFLMWLGELISEKGIGNGISLIIFAGIIAQLPSSLNSIIVNWDPSKIPTIVAFLFVSLIVIAGVVVITEGERAIPVSYAKRVRGMKMYGGVSTHLPLRVNQAGVIPIIFALSIMYFPGLISGFLSGSKIELIAKIAKATSTVFQNQLFYGTFYFILVILFTYFYTAVTFDPKNISENLQKQGGFIPGIRPGKPTAEFLYRVLNRIILVGAIFLGIIAVLPFIVQSATGIQSLAIGGTGLLIVVSVVLETMKQVNAQLVMRDYEGIR